MKFTIGKYPDLAGPLRALAKRHREFEDEPLHLALAYDPGRDPDHIFLFELLGRFGRDEVSPDSELFEVTFGPTESLPMAKGQRLHLILTNPSELRAALARGWPSMVEIRDAIRRGDFEVLYEDEEGREALRLMHD